VLLHTFSIRLVHLVKVVLHLFGPSQDLAVLAFHGVGQGDRLLPFLLVLLVGILPLEGFLSRGIELFADICVFACALGEVLIAVRALLLQAAHLPLQLVNGFVLLGDDLPESVVRFLGGIQLFMKLFEF